GGGGCVRGLRVLRLRAGSAWFRLRYHSPKPSTDMKILLIAGLASYLLAAPPPPAATPSPAEEEIYPSNLMVDQDVTVACHITGIIDVIHVDPGSVGSWGPPRAALDAAECDSGVTRRRESRALGSAQRERTEARSA